MVGQLRAARQARALRRQHLVELGHHALRGPLDGVRDQRAQRKEPRHHLVERDGTFAVGAGPQLVEVGNRVVEDLEQRLLGCAELALARGFERPQHPFHEDLRQEFEQQLRRAALLVHRPFVEALAKAPVERGLERRQPVPAEARRHRDAHLAVLGTRERDQPVRSGGAQREVADEPQVLVHRAPHEHLLHEGRIGDEDASHAAVGPDHLCDSAERPDHAQHGGRGILSGQGLQVCGRRDRDLGGCLHAAV